MATCFQVNSVRGAPEWCLAPRGTQPWEHLLGMFVFNTIKQYSSFPRTDLVSQKFDSVLTLNLEIALDPAIKGSVPQDCPRLCF